MKNKFLNVIVAVATAAVFAGCNKPSETTSAAKPLKAPKAPATEAPAVETPVAEAPVAESAAPAVAEVAPGSSEPPAPPQADTMVFEAPLEGKARKLTPDEMSLLSYGLEMFKEANKRYPRDLEEAVKSRYIRVLPKLPPGEKLKYDAKTGQLTVAKG